MLVTCHLYKILKAVDFFRYGCRVLVSRNTRKAHENRCQFKPIHCPYAYAGCMFLGPAKAVMNHLKKIHLTKFVKGDAFDVFVDSLTSKLTTTICKEKSNAVILSCHKRLFVCKVTFHNNSLRFSFKKLAPLNDNGEKKNFGVLVEICGVNHSTSAMVYLSKNSEKRKIKLLSEKFFSKNDGNDNVFLIVKVKCIDDITEKNGKDEEKN